MKIINLKDFYSMLYDRDYFCNVPEEVAELLITFKRGEEAQRRRIYNHKAYYSLDRGDGIDSETALRSPSAEESYFVQMRRAKLVAALSSLTDKQFRRLYAHFFFDLSYAAIARMENVDESTIRKTIQTALKQLRKFF